MEQLPLVSVLITVYNGMPFIRQAVDHILGQNYPNFELVIVDDASSDETPAYLHSLNNPGIRVVARGKLGRGRALNEGLKHCQGKYVAINDADDYSVPERLSRQVAFLEDHPEYGLVGSNFIKLFSDGKEEPSNKPTDDATLRRELSKHSCIQHSAVLFRKSVLDQLGGYNLGIKYLYDRDIYIRVAAVSKIANLPDHLVVINRHDNQFFLNTYKGLERQLYSLKYSFIAIQKLGLPRYLYVQRVLSFAYAMGLNYLRQVFRLWRK